MHLLALDRGVMLADKVLEMQHMTGLPIAGRGQLVNQLVMLDQLSDSSFVALGDRIVPIGENRATRMRRRKDSLRSGCQHNVVHRLRRVVRTDG